MTEWKDQSGNGNHAEEPATSTPDHRPIFQSAGTGLNGHASLLFNVSGQTLPIRLEVPHNSMTSSDTMSVFAMARTTGTNTGVLVKKGQYILRVGVTSGVPVGVLSTNGGVTDVPIVANQFQLLSGTYDRAYRRVSNGVDFDLTAYTYAITADTLPLMIGTSTTAASSLYSFQGEIAELLVYNRGLSPGERQEVEAYLKRRYGTLGSSNLAFPLFSEWDMNNGGYAYSLKPKDISLTAAAGAQIYWTTDPNISTSEVEKWNVYRKPLRPYYTTSFRTFCRLDSQPSQVSPENSGIFALDPAKYPAPNNDATPPGIILEAPADAVDVTPP